MPKAKTGNFTLKKIAVNVPAALAAHRFADLQRSGQYSELRFIRRGKSAFDIVGYRWPDKGVRRRLNIGRARQNPIPHVVGEPVEVYTGDQYKEMTWTPGTITKHHGADAAGRHWYTVKYSTGAGNVRNRLFDGGEIRHVKNPGDLFTTAQLDKLRKEMAGIKTMSTEQLPRLHKIFDKAGDAAIMQLTTARINFISKLAVNEAMRRGLYGQNPNMSTGPTPNQVTFGTRGKTKVGWINQETPTRYQITFKDGRQTKTVWRDKSKVRFMAGKKSSRKNPCPKTANPGSRALNQALDLSRRFHGAKPRKVREINFRAPQSLVSIGQCAQLDYVSDKFDGRRRRYFHEFEQPCTVLADPQRQADGQSLIVLLGKFKITERGIIG